MDCRACKFESYFIIREIRAHFAEIAIVAPEDAESILDGMITEDGTQFADLVLDGLPTKLLKKEGAN